MGVVAPLSPPLYIVDVLIEIDNIYAIIQRLVC